MTNTHECTTRVSTLRLLFRQLQSQLNRAFDGVDAAIADAKRIVDERSNDAIFPPYPEHKPKGVGIFTSPKVVEATPLRRFFN